MADHPARPTDAAPAKPGTRVQRWPALLPTAAFYSGWAGAAWLSHLTGTTTLAGPAAGLLAFAIFVTHVLLASLKLPGHDDRASAAVAGSGLAIAWTSIYAVLAEGPGELVPAMYLTAVLIAWPRGRATDISRLALGAALACALALGVRLLGGETASGLVGTLLPYFGLLAALALLVRGVRRTENGRRALAVQVNRLQQELARVTRQAERDHLTKSFNRQYIMDALRREKARADRTGIAFSICIFDLDRFKSLNDAHGHLAGDRVLTAFAHRARRELRSMDAINPTRFRRALGRFGGEEFIAVLPGTRVDGALRCAERVREAVAREPVDRQIAITVSAGVAEYRPGESVAELLMRADQAMYVAKRSGRNRVRVGIARGPDGPITPKPRLRIIR